MKPELRGVLTWLSRILSWFSVFFGVVLVATAIPREVTSSARLPHPYVLGEIPLIARILWIAVCGAVACYTHSLARGFDSGTLDDIPRPRLPWESKP